MTTRFWTIAAAVTANLLILGCGGSSKRPTPQSEHGRLVGFSSDDKARCDFKGRPDRDVSEGTAPGAAAPNIRRVYQMVGEGSDRRKVLVCREVDTNLDGVKDVVRTFNDKGETLREEADGDYNGKIDTWITYANGRITKQILDLNSDGKPDEWKFYTNGKLARIQRDTNGDGQADVWEIYARGQLERLGVDTDFDGHVDRWDRDEMARVATTTREAADSKPTTGVDTDSTSGAKTSADAGASAQADGGASAATKAPGPQDTQEDPGDAAPSKTKAKKK